MKVMKKRLIYSGVVAGVIYFSLPLNHAQGAALLYLTSIAIGIWSAYTWRGESQAKRILYSTLLLTVLATSRTILDFVYSFLWQAPYAIGAGGGSLATASIAYQSAIATMILLLISEGFEYLLRPKSAKDLLS